MPTFDVYLIDPNQNPFTPRLTQPVFRGVEAESEQDVEKYWERFKTESPDHKDMKIDRIIEIE